jgi:hypothetical protein
VACKEKHLTDKLKLKDYNTKISNKTITDKEKKQRLNLIRQINSRNYRVQNKELICKLKGVIESISKIADEQNITEIQSEISKLNKPDDDMMLTDESSDEV